MWKNNDSDKVIKPKSGKLGYLLGGLFIIGTASGFVAKEANSAFEGLERAVVEMFDANSATPEFNLNQKLRDPENLFYYLINYVPETSSLTRTDSSLFNSVVEKMDVFGPIAEDVKLKQGIPMEFNLGKTATESGGNKFAVSSAQAIGPYQITFPTYNSIQSQINYDVSQLNKLVSDSVISKEKLDSLVDRTMFDYLTFDSKKEGFDFSDILKKMYGENVSFEKKNDYMLHRLPLALLTMREYEGKVPYDKGGVRSTLVNPEKSAHIMGLITWSNLLKNVALDASLQEKTFGSYSVLNTNLTKEALSTSYIAGPGASFKILKEAYPKKNALDTEGKMSLYAFGPENVQKYFDSNMSSTVRNYRDRIWKLTDKFKTELNYSKNDAAVHSHYSNPIMSK